MGNSMVGIYICVGIFVLCFAVGICEYHKIACWIKKLVENDDRRFFFMISTGFRAKGAGIELHWISLTYIDWITVSYIESAVDIL